MKVVAFNGSPKAERSATNIMVESFLQGAKEAGADTANVFLAQKKISHCLGCFSCWTKTPGKCVHNDDMQELMNLMATADIIVFATPLYVDNVTGIMKDFMDRLIPGGDPYFEKDANGEYRHRKTDKKLGKLVIISNCGFPEQTHFQVLHLLFQRIARNMDTDVVAEIYRGEGGLLAEKNILLKPIISKYKKQLRQAGKEVIENMKLSDELQEKLAKPLIPYDYYIKAAEKYWDKFHKKA